MGRHRCQKLGLVDTLGDLTKQTAEAGKLAKLTDYQVKH